MGFLDTFKGNQYKAELENLQKEYDLLKSSLTPEMNDVVSLNREIAHLQDKFAAEQDNMNNLIYTIDDKNRELACLEQDIAEKRKQLVCLDDDIMVQEFGLYTPKFDFAYALDYKEALSRIRDKQKALIKNNMAVTGDTS
jgi:chromosome segregation ATPase